MNGKIQKIYTTLALVYLNTTLVFCGCLLLASFIPVTPGGFHTSIGQQYSETFKTDAYYFLSQEEAKRLGKVYDEYASQGHWQVHPWTGLINRQFKSPYLNVDENGLRQTAEPSPEHAEKPLFVVWAFGGSTMFGWGVADEYTLPSQLQRALQERMPAYQVKVINFGVPYYNSQHELILFLSALRTSDPPDMAIFLDGLNEVGRAIFYSGQEPLFIEMEKAWEAWITPFTAETPWITINYTFPLAGLLKSGQPERNAPVPESELEKTTLVQDAIDIYLQNAVLIDTVGNTAGVETFLFLQPLPAWSDDGGITNPYYAMFVDRVREKATVPVHNITDALSSEYGKYELLVDTANHYTDRATLALATYLADYLLKNR